MVPCVFHACDGHLHRKQELGEKDLVFHPVTQADEKASNTSLFLSTLSSRT